MNSYDEPHWIVKYGFENRGWYERKLALKVANVFSVALYALHVGARCPKQNSNPWEEPGTKYIGLAGGTLSEYMLDDKRGDGTRLFRKTPVLARIQTHLNQLFTENPKQLAKLPKNYLDMRQCLLENAHTLRICILAPNMNLPDEILQKYRAKVSACEGEAIRLYEDRWGLVPVGNRAHSSELTSRKEDSITAKALKVANPLY